MYSNWCCMSLFFIFYCGGPNRTTYIYLPTVLQIDESLYIDIFQQLKSIRNQESNELSCHDLQSIISNYNLANEAVIVTDLTGGKFCIDSVFIKIALDKGTPGQLRHSGCGTAGLRAASSFMATAFQSSGDEP